MEQKAPKIAVFASVLAVLSSLTLLVNAFAGKFPGHAGERVLLLPLFEHLFLDGAASYWKQTGWSLQETIWAIATLFLILISVWGRQLRPVPELPKQPTVAEQIESFESIATPVSSNYSKQDNERTSSIISSILGDTRPNMDSQTVSSAITSLSSGSIGAYASAVVAERNSTVSESVMESEQLEGMTVDSETLQLSPRNTFIEESMKEEKLVDDGRNFVSDGPAYIPLPGVSASVVDTPPVRKTQIEFVSDGPASIPLPELPDLEEESLEIPQLPDIDSLFDESIKEVLSLPNLDDLF
jgi:hypothetical protein